MTCVTLSSSKLLPYYLQRARDGSDSIFFAQGQGVVIFVDVFDIRKQFGYLTDGFQYLRGQGI